MRSAPTQRWLNLTMKWSPLQISIVVKPMASAQLETSSFPQRPEGVESVAISSSTWRTSLSQNTWQRRLQCPASIKTLQVCCFTQNLGFSHTLSRNGKTRKETRLYSFTCGCHEMQPNIPVEARLRRWDAPLASRFRAPHLKRSRALNRPGFVGGSNL